MSLLENFSPKKNAPEKEVKRGARKAMTVASDSERYCSEKYMPNSPKKLGEENEYFSKTVGVRRRGAHPTNPRRTRRSRIPLGPVKGSGTPVVSLEPRS